MVSQPVGGIIAELVSMSIPHPRYIRKIKRFGDIGVSKIAFAVGNVKSFYSEYSDRIKFFAEPRSMNLEGWGEYNFVYGRDAEGNLLEFVAAPKLGVTGPWGGACWLGVAVTDLDRSLDFWRSVAFDEILVEPHEKLSGLVDEVADARETRVRSCLLRNSGGGGMLELYECVKPRGRSIPFNTTWGDFGYFEVCLETENFHEMAQQIREMKLDVLHSPCLAFDLEDRQYWFEYIQDPDGIVLEIIGVILK